MASPIIVNRSPNLSKVAAPDSIIRASLRASTNEILRNTINFYTGSGPTVFDPAKGDLPDSDLAAWSGSTSEVLTAALSAGSLVLTKSTAGLVKGIYPFGGLSSPANPTDPLILQFTVSVNPASIIQDADNWSGVLAGFKINNTGIMVKFFTNGTNQSIQLLTAAVSNVSDVTHSSSYTWADSLPHTYVLLWYPKTDTVTLYETTPATIPAVVIISAAVSNFPGPLASNEIPGVQPAAFFGHGGTGTAISKWGSVNFLNSVSTIIQGGVYQGGHVGLITTNSTVDYPFLNIPAESNQPWLTIPHAPTPGAQTLEYTKKLTLRKPLSNESVGFFRYETKLDQDITIIDFSIAGLLTDRVASSGEATGMELYVDDGTKRVVIGLLDAAGTQYIGILTGNQPQFLSSYTTLQTSWIIPRDLKLKINTAGNVELLIPSRVSGFYLETALLSIPYWSLPASTEDPSIGLLLNGSTVEAETVLTVDKLKYSTGIIEYRGDSLPAAPWYLVGSVTPTISGGSITIAPGLAEESFVGIESIPLGSDNGWFVEFRMQINSFSQQAAVGLPSYLTGTAVIVDDGTYQYTILYISRYSGAAIVAIATSDNYEKVVEDIYNSEVSYNYADLDSSIPRYYRLERDLGKDLKLFIDDNPNPIITIPADTFTPPPSPGGVKGFRFGNLVADIYSDSTWEYFRYNVSSGFDVGGKPVISKEETLKKLNHAVCSIIHAEES